MKVEDGGAGLRVSYRDRKSARIVTVEVPVGYGLTRQQIRNMDTGNLFKMGRLSMRYRRLLAEVYHTDAGVRDERKHLQNAMSELEGMMREDEVTPQERERLIRVAHSGREVALMACKHYDRHTGRCSHGDSCSYVHFSD